MPHLIDELKADHASILDTLKQVKEAGVTSEAGRERLRDAKRHLVDHLQREDARFYPAVQRAARDNAELKRLVQVFADDMEAISKNALDFFDTYAEGGSGIDFARDFGRLYATIWRRQQKEEQFLYPEFERLA